MFALEFPVHSSTLEFKKHHQHILLLIDSDFSNGKSSQGPFTPQASLYFSSMPSSPLKPSLSPAGMVSLPTFVSPLFIKASPHLREAFSGGWQTQQPRYSVLSCPALTSTAFCSSALSHLRFLSPFLCVCVCASMYVHIYTYTYSFVYCFSLPSDCNLHEVRVVVTCQGKRVPFKDPTVGGNVKIITIQ